MKYASVGGDGGGPLASLSTVDLSSGRDRRLDDQNMYLIEKPWARTILPTTKKIA